MKLEDIVVGKTYRIRQWDDMAAEYNVNPDRASGITPPNSLIRFDVRMKPLSGMPFTVSGFRDETSMRSEEGTEYIGNVNSGWYIEAWMLEEIEEEIAEPDKDLFGFLFA